MVEEDVDAVALVLHDLTLVLVRDAIGAANGRPVRLVTLDRAMVLFGGVKSVVLERAKLNQGNPETCAVMFLEHFFKQGQTSMAHSTAVPRWLLGSKRDH